MQIQKTRFISHASVALPVGGFPGGSFREAPPGYSPEHGGISRGAAMDQQLAEAARVSFQARDGDGTGWSVAWKINFWARLRDGDQAYGMIRRLMQPHAVIKSGEPLELQFDRRYANDIKMSSIIIGGIFIPSVVSSEINLPGTVIDVVPGLSSIRDYGGGYYYCQ